MEACGRTSLISTTYLVASIIFFSSQVLGCQDSPVGIANSSVIPDDRFTATSSWSDVKNEPWDARLNGTDYGWAPRTPSDPSDYLQIDLGQAFLICAVATQGCSGCGWIEWTTQYKISSSIDNNTWVMYKNGTNDELFPGNTDCNTVVKNVLDVPVLVRYIRFIPIAYYGWKTVRLEAYGHKRDHQWTLPPPRVENITSTSATVRWSKPSQANVTSFIIKYENNNNTGVLNVSGSEVSANITDLTPYTNYSISIKAMSTAGHGQWSGSTNFRTASARPYVFPVSVAANSLTSQSIRVTWQASKCGSNGPLRGYKISCAPISVNRTKEYATKAEQTSYNITNLEKWAEYRITVKCFNDNGEGPASVEVIVRTLEDAPGKPENFEAMVLSSTSIQLEWALPTETNGIIRGFKLRYENLTQNIGSSTNETLSANATLSYLLTGLERCTPYSFKLLAYTIKDGPYTDAIQRTTAENDCKYNAAVGIADPNIIPDNRFTATSSWFNNRNQPWDARLNGADYGWAPRTPSDPSDYLQIDLGQDFVICAVATQGCNGCSERTTQYKISTSVNGVWATYKNGIADKLFPGNTDSNTVVKNVLDVPVLVRYIRFIPTAYNTRKTLRVEAYGFMKDLQWTSPAPRVENLTSTSATVRWRKPNQANVTSFIIKYENNNNTGVLNVSGSEVSANITDLTPYTNYSVKIKAVSKTGHGQWSCSTNFSTDSARPETSPMSVTLYSPTSQSIHVTWQAPTSGINGPFLGYRVFCISGSDRRESTATPQQTGHTFSALRKWTVYNVTVVVRNDKGDGPINAYVTLRTLEDAPGQPQRFQVTVLSSTAVQLNWSLPSETNGIIRGFKLRYEKTGNWLEKDLPGNTTLSYVLTGLDKRTQYSFKMLAYTIKEGPLTPAILKTTPEDDPSAPTILEGNIIKSNGPSVPQVELTWRKPLGFLAGPGTLIGKGNVPTIQEPPCIGRASQSDTNSSIFAVSLAFNVAFLVFIVLLIVYNARLRKKLEFERSKNAENSRPTTAFSQELYSNTNSVISEGSGLPMVPLPFYEKPTYEAIDSSGVHLSQVQTRITDQHDTPSDKGSTGVYETINTNSSARPNPKPKPTPKPGQRIYETVQPAEQAENPQERPASSLTYQSLIKENMARPVYQSLHTYANTKGKFNKDGEYNI